MATRFNCPPFVGCRKWCISVVPLAPVVACTRTVRNRPTGVVRLAWAMPVGCSSRRYAGRTLQPGSVGYLKMLTARAATRSRVVEEGADSVSIRSLDQRLHGIALDGLEAVRVGVEGEE